MGAIGHLFGMVIEAVSGLFGGLSEIFPAWMMWFTEADEEEASYEEEDDEEICA